MKEKNQIITDLVVKENIIKIPEELKNKLHNTRVNDVSVNEDVVTFTFIVNHPSSPPPDDDVLEIWQYVHHNEMWVKSRFIK